MVAKDTGGYRGHPDITDPEELFTGPRAADVSLEASGFHGRDIEDRDGGEREWEGELGEDKAGRGGGTGDGLGDRHRSPDLEALIG